MPQDDRGVVCPPPVCRPWRGRPRSSRLSLGDPSRVDFRLVFYPLVTPLRRDDQGLLSDEASGFTSCAARDRNFLMPNRCIGTWSWCIAPATACTVHITVCSVHAIACTPYATALTVGPFVGQGCERSELPCLGRGGKKLGRRSWSFYVCGGCCRGYEVSRRNCQWILKYAKIRATRAN